MGVASNRVDVKQAAARAERSLERTAEPLAALLMAPERYPASVLQIAWRELVRNSAHDSICACSHDEVDAAVLHRYAEATRLAEGVTERALRELASSLSEPCHVAVNPSARPRSGVIELILGGTGPIEGAQVLDERVGLAAQLVLTTNEVRGVLAQLDGQDQMGEGAYIAGVDVEEDETGIDIAVRVLPERSGELRVAEIKSDLLARFALRPEAQVRVRLDQASSRRVLVRVEDVPGFGWKAWQPAPLRDPVDASTEADGRVVLANSLVTVELSPTDGTFALDGSAGLQPARRRRGLRRHLQLLAPRARPRRRHPRACKPVHRRIGPRPGGRGGRAHLPLARAHRRGQACPSRRDARSCSAPGSSCAPASTWSE